MLHCSLMATGFHYYISIFLPIIFNDKTKKFNKNVSYDSESKRIQSGHLSVIYLSD